MVGAGNGSIVQCQMPCCYIWATHGQQHFDQINGLSLSHLVATLHCRECWLCSWYHGACSSYHEALAGQQGAPFFSLDHRAAPVQCMLVKSAIWMYTIEEHSISGSGQVLQAICTLFIVNACKPCRALLPFKRKDSFPCSGQREFRVISTEVARCYSSCLLSQEAGQRFAQHTSLLYICEVHQHCGHPLAGLRTVVFKRKGIIAAPQA